MEKRQKNFPLENYNETKRKDSSHNAKSFLPTKKQKQNN